MLDKAQEPSNDVDLKERCTVSIGCSKSWILAPFLQHLLSCHQPRDCDCGPLARNKRHFCLFYVVCELELPCEFVVALNSSQISLYTKVLLHNPGGTFVHLGTLQIVTQTVSKAKTRALSISGLTANSRNTQQQGYSPGIYSFPQLNKKET